MRPRLRTVGKSTDRRSGLWLVAHENFTKYGTTKWTTVCRSIYGPFYRSVVPIKDQLFGTFDLRKGSTDLRLASASGSEPPDAFDFGFGSATGSGSHDKAASFDEATSSGEVLVPRSYDPDPVAGEPNKWCVERQWQIYQDARMLNEKEKMA
uniref:Integrase core domain containing protein n=1 Tax=Solanum tuberosum TaxID=4113 RepID=M1DLZ1_SOLTU